MKRREATKDDFQATNDCLNESTKSLRRIRKSVKEGQQIVIDTTEQIKESKQTLANSPLIDPRLFKMGKSD